MSPVLSAPRLPATATATARARSVVPALARQETRRLVTHPAVLVGTVLSILWLRLTIGNRLPVLHRDDMATAMALLPLAAMTLVAAHLAASRAARDDTEELYGSMAASVTARVAAHLASVAGAFLLAGGLVAGWVAYLLVAGGIGSPSPAELATGPVLVAVGGVVGVLLGTWWPSPSAAPLAVTGLAVIEIVLMSRGGPDSPLRRLAPWVPPAGERFPVLAAGLPRELMVRRPGWHLAYVAAVGVIAGVLALGRLGQGHGGRWRLVAAGVAGLVLLAGSTWSLTRPATGSQVAAMVRFVERPHEVQVCDDRAGVRYCAYPAYRELVDRWARAVDGALRVVPDEVRGRGLEVRQRVAFAELAGVPGPVYDRLAARPGDGHDAPRAWSPDAAVRPEMRWARGGDDAGVVELALALQAATWSVGIEPRTGTFCSVPGGAPTALALWIGAQATPGAGAALRRAYDRPAAAIGPFGDGVAVTGSMWTSGAMGELHDWPRAELAVALALLDRPSQDVGSSVRAHWVRLVDPQASTSELLQLLDVAAPVPLDRSCS